MGDDAKITINTKDVTYGPGATVGGIASPLYEYTFDPLDSMSLGSTTSDITISMPEYTDDNWPSEYKVNEMILQYPALRIQYEKFLEVYNLVKDDYKDDIELLT